MPECCGVVRLHKNSVLNGMERTVGVAAVVCLAVTALWLLTLSFVVHITPDTSIYLLHARTFGETLNRFELSHDSKGIMLTLMLALPVKLFGATMAAGAGTQAVAYLLAAGAIAWLMRPRLMVAMALACLWLIAAFSPLMWGGRCRPEDFGVAFAMIALAAAYRGQRLGMVMCGAMAAMGFLTKVPLALVPMGLGVAAGLLPTRHETRNVRNIVRDLAWLAAGFVVVTGIVLGWVVLMDDPVAWFRQTLQWPAEFKRAVGKAGLSLMGVGNLFALLQAGRLQWLFVGSIAGLFFGWRRGARRLVILLAVFLSLECVRVIIEGEPWHYLVSVMVAPMVIGAALSGCNRQGVVTMRGVGVVLVLLGPVLAATIPDAFLATQTRMVGQEMTPFETLADRMVPLYRKGEQIMVNGQGCQVLLYLRAPRPYPVLPLHLHAVSPAEYAAAEAHFRAHPPEWIIDSQPGWSPVPFHCIGHPDHLAYAYIPEGEPRRTKASDRLHLGDRYAPNRDAINLARRLLIRNPYRLTVDTGLHQAWHLKSAE